VHESLGTEANCGLLLDVNNVFVSSVNHDFDPAEFVQNRFAVASSPIG